MTLPKKITIGGIDYKVEIVPENVCSNLLGRITVVQGVISLLDNQCYDQKVATLLHEIGHAIVDAVYLDFGDNEEKIVQSMATGFHQALKPYLSFAKEK